MGDVDIEHLSERFISRLVAACVRREVPVEGIDTGVLEMSVESSDEGPVLVMSLLGTKSWIGFDGSESEAIEILDQEAERMAEEPGGRLVGRRRRLEAVPHLTADLVAAVTWDAVAMTAPEEPVEFAEWFDDVTRGDVIPSGLRDWMLGVYVTRGPLDRPAVERAFVDAQLEQARHAVKFVLADLEASGMASPAVQVDQYDGSVRITVDGGFSTPSATAPPWDATLMVVDVAAYLQAELQIAWPVCPIHNSGLHARALGRRAVWWCPIGHHAAAEIGILGHT